MKSVLFVCSGNTCRSPMAAAIAHHYCLANRLECSIRSAGTQAVNGSTITSEAGAVLERLNVPFDHSSTKLTEQLVASSDVIFAMENRHLTAVRALSKPTDGSPAPKSLLLDNPLEIHDPLGRGYGAYLDIANRMMEVIPVKFRDIGTPKYCVSLV